ncbi:hypothetical protein BGX20_003826 [Mortierella sp. AD010]|nr:hypothetical protein BGX20_003826 [Mortierella sp. AD010]
MNERQFFSEVALPSFRKAFRQIGKDMELFEIKILGSQRRKNINRTPMVEKVIHSHQADAVVSHGGLQIVLFECAPPNTNDADKPFLDHYKLARDLKDTWIYNVEALIKDGREPPKGLSVYGVQVAGNRMELYSLDFKGCFRLQELAIIKLPAQLDNFQVNFKNLVQTSFNFANLVKDELDRWDSAPTLIQAKKRKAERAIGLLPKTNATPTKVKKTRISQDDEDL